ncbi:MAG: glutamyl-tRNA reductase [Chloroflexi bacterium]|nr:glutamyl-tRNA reductase [Chloroflexota bacterium]
MSPRLLAASITNRTAPITFREVVAQAARRLWDSDNLQTDFMARSGIQEMVLLSTCNRTEIYALTTHTGEAAVALAKALLPAASNSAEARPAQTPALTFYHNIAAAEHIFQVASGMDSLMIGETEILGQVRQTYEIAQARRTLGPVLHQLFRDAIRVARRTHTETPISSGATSIAYAAVVLATRWAARQTPGTGTSSGLRGRRVLVLGAGEIGRRVALNLRQDAARTIVRDRTESGGDLLVTSRTWAHALHLAEELQGEAIPLADLPQTIATVDVAISALSAAQPVLTKAMLENARGSRASNPLCLIDIAMPRNIDPQVACLPGVDLFNLDDLKEIAAKNLQERQAALAAAGEIVRQEASNFWRWFRARRAVPAIVELRQQAEAIRQAELNEALHRLGHLEPRDQEIIRAMSAGLVNKLLHAPTTMVKEQLAGGFSETGFSGTEFSRLRLLSEEFTEKESSEAYLHLFRALFALPEDDAKMQGQVPS